MDGELQLNVALPSGNDFGELKEKKSAKQRKIKFELRRAHKKKMRLEWEEKKKKREAAKRSAEMKKRETANRRSKEHNKEDNGFAASILRVEILPSIHSKECKLVFPHLALEEADNDSLFRKNSSGKTKSKNRARKNNDMDKNFKKTKKTGELEDKGKDVSKSRGELVSFVKKHKISHTTKDQGNASGAMGRFLRKSKNVSNLSKKDFQFAFTDSSGKTNAIENFSGDNVFQVPDGESETKVDGDAEGAKRSQHRRRKEVSGADSSRTASKGLSGADSDSEAAYEEEEQSEAKKSNRGSFRDGAGDKNARGKYFSLFGNNPEIPDVPRRAVRPVQEPVFSSQRFSDLDIHKFLVSNLASLELTQLTTVQRKAIPVLLAGRDALVRSQTGSGKTLAYALPLVELLQRQQPPLTRADGVRALVVLPTRELALQTYECFLKLVKPFMRLVPGCLVGGEKRKSEKARLRKGITILVGTPGRVLDHVQNTRSLRLNRVQYLVLDEADLLLDMGYERDVASIVSELDSQSQPLLSKDVLEWNRKTYGSGKESRNENSKKKDKNKVTGYTSQDSGAGDVSSDEVTKEVRKVEEMVMKKTEVKLQREEDETSDYDPEERADEVVDEKELEGEGWDEESSEEEEEEEYRKEEDVWEVEGAGEDEGDCEGEAGGAGTRERERRRQTVLLSATLTSAVERLAGLALLSPDFVDAADVEADTKDVVIPESLMQFYIVVPAKLRLVTLSAFILWKCKFSKERKMLLFCATQDMVDYLTELLTVGLSRKDTDEEEDSDDDDLEEVGVDFFRLHGNMDQKERTLVFQTFRAAESGVLLCTDVAARGLDLPRVDWIVQLTAPGSVPDYVHRVGRTARVGAAGSALLFLLPTEADFVQLLQDRRIRLQEEKMANCLKILRQAISSSELGESTTVEAAATALQLRYENAVLQRRSLHSSAVKAYVSFVRFYASYPKEVRDVFCFKELHLGHQAKSFALRDPPRAIAGIGRRRFHQQRQQQSGARAPAGKLAKPQQQQQQQEEGAPSRPRLGSGQAQAQTPAVPRSFQPHDRRRMRDLVLSEFDSGLGTSKKRRKTDFS